MAPAEPEMASIPAGQRPIPGPSVTRFRLRVLVFSVVAATAAISVWMWFREVPDKTFARALRAVEKQDFKEVAKAIAILEKYPDFRQHITLLRGCSLLGSGEISRALREFSRTRPEGEIRFPALLYAGQALYRDRKLHDAGQLLAALVTEDPGNAEGHRWLGAVYYDMGMLSEASAELSQCIRLNPDDFRPHRLLGSICTEQALYVDAVEHYRSALKLGKGIPQPDIEVDLATLLIGRNEFAEGLEALKDSQATSTVWALRADCYDGLGQPEKSREAVTRAMLADANDPRALLLNGTQQLFDGNAQGAIEPLTRLLEQDPHHTAARYQLAMAYLKLGQTEAWRREMDKRDSSDKLHERFRDAVIQAAKEPENVEVRKELATIAASLGKHDVAGRWEMAAKACRAAVELEQTKQQENH